MLPAFPVLIALVSLMEYVYSMAISLLSIPQNQFELQFHTEHIEHHLLRATLLSCFAAGAVRIFFSPKLKHCDYGGSHPRGSAGAVDSIRD